MQQVQWRPSQPLDLTACVARYTRWGADPVHVVSGGVYHRALVGDQGAFAYRARQRRSGTVVIEAATRDQAAAGRDDLRRRLGGNLDPSPVAALAGRDAVIGRLWHRFPGYRPPVEPDPFEAIVTSITAQQVNLRWAATTRTRLVEHFGGKVEMDGAVVRTFPSPARIAAADPMEIFALQFTMSKARSTVAVAQAAMAGVLDGLHGLPDDEVRARVTGLYGVGPWTADWLLARGMARPQAVAAGDLGVRKAVGMLYLGGDGPVSEATVREIAAGWGDAANWAAHLLLEALAVP